MASSDQTKTGIFRLGYHIVNVKVANPFLCITSVDMAVGIEKTKNKFYFNSLSST